MRGFIYEVAPKAEDLESVNECDYYDRLTELGADYVEEQEEEDREDAISSIIDVLKENGFTVGTEDGLHYFIPTMEVRRKMAEKALNDFKMHAAKLTVEDLETDSLELYRTKQSLENTYGDLFVIPNCSEYPLLKWLGNLTDDDFGKKFYFGNVICMG